VTILGKRAICSQLRQRRSRIVKIILQVPEGILEIPLSSPQFAVRLAGELRKSGYYQTQFRPFWKFFAKFAEAATATRGGGGLTLSNYIPYFSIFT
jgi:hypothetical protein